ncbi:hypothetical protein [Muriicola sp.]|uniref:hypothetical protein n=1 Tax=Muriicola sp. TaxID=2020856 RepID=UPI003C782905
MTGHGKYRRYERSIYRILIVVCALAVILAIIAIYFFGENDTTFLELGEQLT